MKRNRSYQKKKNHNIRPRVSHLTNDNFYVNTTPCGMLAWGKSILNVKSCVSPTGPDHSKYRETVYLDQCPETGGTEQFVRLSNVPNVAHICL